MEDSLGFLALFVFILAVLCLQGIVRVLLDLPFYYVLRFNENTIT